MAYFFIVACVLLQAQRRDVLQKNSLHPAACLCEQHSIRLLASPAGQDHRQTTAATASLNPRVTTPPTVSRGM